GAFDDGKADGKENVLDFLEDLANEVTRADGADYAGEGEIDAVFGARRTSRKRLDVPLARFERGFHMGFQPVEFLADRALEFGSRRLQPIVGDEGEDAGFSARPSLFEKFPIRSIELIRCLAVETRAHFREELRNF